MDAGWIRDLCLSFPAVTEHVIWGSDLTFKVAGKMFAHAVLEPAPVWLSIKASPENFYDLTERPGIIPAPYRARAQWVALETKDALSSPELGAMVRDSYDIIVAKLPKKTRDSLKANILAELSGASIPPGKAVQVTTLLNLWMARMFPLAVILGVVIAVVNIFRVVRVSAPTAHVPGETTAMA